MLVLVCSEQQMKQVKNYKYKDQECATYGRPYITPGVNHIQPNQHACLCIFKFLNQQNIYPTVALVDMNE